VDGTIIELWNQLNEKQTWEVEPISINVVAVILSVEQAKVSQNELKIDPDEFLNKGKEDVDHEFKFDKVLKDEFQFGNVNGFSINESVKFKVPEFVLNDQDKPVLDDSKATDMALGENTREVKISLSKTLTVQPDKKVVGVLKLIK